MVYNIQNINCVYIYIYVFVRVKIFILLNLLFIWTSRMQRDMYMHMWIYIYTYIHACISDIACWHVYILRYICIYVYTCIIAVVESGRATAAWLPSSAGDPLPALHRNLSGLGATYVAAQAKSGVENKQMPEITHVAVIAYQAADWRNLESQRTPRTLTG